MISLPKFENVACAAQAVTLRLLHNMRRGVGPLAVIKTIDLVGVSTESWEDAARQALAEASKTIRAITSMDVSEQTAIVGDSGEIAEYHSHVQIHFRLERA
jgi:flavin-binding protein dodecin